MNTIILTLAPRAYDYDYAQEIGDQEHNDLRDRLRIVRVPVEHASYQEARYHSGGYLATALEPDTTHQRWDVQYRPQGPMSEGIHLQYWPFAEGVAEALKACDPDKWDRLMVVDRLYTHAAPMSVQRFLEFQELYERSPRWNRA